MTRAYQNAAFIDMLTALLAFCKTHDIRLRGGEWNRPSLLAKIYSTGINVVNRGVQLFSPKVGIQNSKHLVSLAVDLWITDDSGKQILWEDAWYEVMGKFWEGLGGTWGGRFKSPDIYHFELKDNPL